MVPLVMPLVGEVHHALGVGKHVNVCSARGGGYANAEAVAFAWLAYGMVVLQGLLGGIVYVLRKQEY